MNHGVLLSYPLLLLSCSSYVLPTISAGVYSKAVVCRVLSLPHPQRSFVKGLSEARRRAAERKVSKSHSSKTLESHAGSVSLRFFLFVVCLSVNLNVNLFLRHATGALLVLAIVARVIQGHSQGEGRRQSHLPVHARSHSLRRSLLAQSFSAAASGACGPLLIVSSMCC